MVNSDIFNNKKRGTVLKTSVGLHSRGVIPAISAGNTSALPAGPPSGGVRVSTAANTTETDVPVRGRRRRRMFFTFGSGKLFSPSAGECRARRREWLVNTEGHDRRSFMVRKIIEKRTAECTNTRSINRQHPACSPQISYTCLAGPPPSALCLRSTQCCLYPMLLAVVAGSFTSLLPCSLPWFSTSSSVACHSAGSQGFKGKLETVFMGYRGVGDLRDTAEESFMLSNYIIYYIL